MKLSREILKVQRQLTNLGANNTTPRAKRLAKRIKELRNIERKYGA